METINEESFRYALSLSLGNALGENHLIKNSENTIEGLDFPTLRRYLVQGRHVECRNLESLRTALYRICYIDVDSIPKKNVDKSQKA